MTPGVERWLEELPGGERLGGGRLPPAVLAVAGRALRAARDTSKPGEIAFSRVLSQAGQWVVLHGASLVTDGPRRVAVIVESAHPARTTPLLMSAYGLTEREQDVTRLVLKCESTAEIASRLVVSPHTVPEHLKNVFEKTGVRIRRELVSKVFFSHYEPRLRDNERRAAAGRPARGSRCPALNRGLPRTRGGPCSAPFAATCRAHVGTKRVGAHLTPLRAGEAELRSSSVRFHGCARRAQICWPASSSGSRLTWSFPCTPPSSERSDRRTPWRERLGSSKTSGRRSAVRRAGGGSGECGRRSKGRLEALLRILATGAGDGGPRPRVASIRRWRSGTGCSPVDGAALREQRRCAGRRGRESVPTQVQRA